MLATIHIEKLEIDCIIGIYEHERTQTQRILVDVAVSYDIARAAEHDDIAHSANYVELADAITELAVAGKYRLLETLVRDSVALILERFAAESAYVKVMKPTAIPNARWTAVSLERKR